MRCNNCGWDNPDSLDRCQKCNQPLFNIGDVNPRATMMDVNPRSTMLETNPRATMAETNSQDLQSETVSLTCLDDGEGTVILLSSPRNLNLHSGDIAFIGGLRYQVK